MRWFFVGMTAAMFVLAVGAAAQACGGGCCCQGKCGGACPSCPGPGPAGSGACPNCPRAAASFAPYRYWDSGYGGYLYYDEGTRSSYYWSEAHRAFYPVSNATRPSSAAAPVSPTSSTYAARYYTPAP
jgi:hypothetical protein